MQTQTEYEQLVQACLAGRPGRSFEILISTRPTDADWKPEMRVVWKRKPRKAKPDPNQVDMFN